MRPTHLCLIVVTCMCLLGCHGKPSASTQKDDPKVTAVSMSLERFLALDWSPRDPVTHIAPNLYSVTIPKLIAGKPVEIISVEDLIKRDPKRKVAPEIVRINVSDAKSKPGIDFYVSVSTSGVSGKDAKFQEIPLGGERVYEFSILNGEPVLGQIQKITF